MEQSVITHRRNVHPAAEAEDAGPPQLRHRRDETVRYTRGGPVYATDGLVGHLRNVVVDEASGQVLEVVIKLRDDQSVVVPIDIVDRTAGNALFLSEPRARFGEIVSDAPRFERGGFARANLKKLLAAASHSDQHRPRAVIARAGEDFVETPSDIATATPTASHAE